ncbi:unnamed protein product [Pieris brassicae]|uniref:Uncharacterized protein n=1 Tax=Pieris brassicae TaxID=7116 RepID=A0A9P0TLI1_PIEBR|nr:unnamed protein product [Pieris brassicae]
MKESTELVSKLRQRLGANLFNPLAALNPVPDKIKSGDATCSNSYERSTPLRRATTTLLKCYTARVTRAEHEITASADRPQHVFISAAVNNQSRGDGKEGCRPQFELAPISRLLTLSRGDRSHDSHCS